MDALVGLALIVAAIGLLMQSVSSSARAEREARERFVAMQWLASALDELRVVRAVRSTGSSSLREATMSQRFEPVPNSNLAKVSMVAAWRTASGARRSAQLSGVIRHAAQTEPSHESIP